MKKKFSLKKLLLVIPAIAITSCGYSLSYLVEGNKYNSPVFKENYYQHWDSDLKNAKELYVIDKDDYITSYREISKIDPLIDTSVIKSVYEYGPKYKMINSDNSFNYGYQSKLFDGRVECEQLYQLSRVQTDKNGFSIAFGKESNELSYLALQFKATTDNTVECMAIGETEVRRHTDDRELFHNSSIELTTSIYFKDDDNIINKISFLSTVNIDNNRTNRGDSYIFYGINLKDLKISRVVGFSINYEYDDDLISWNVEHDCPNKIDYALFLYELFMPYTSWH